MREVTLEKSKIEQNKYIVTRCKNKGEIPTENSRETDAWSRAKGKILIVEMDRRRDAGR